MSLSDKTQKWLAANCVPSLSGKTVLITGANSGIGFKTAETMVYLGANVIMACRNLQRAEEARNTLLQEYPKADISIMYCASERRDCSGCCRRYSKCYRREAGCFI